MSSAASASRVFLPLEREKKENAASLAAIAQQREPSITSISQNTEVTSTILINERQAEELKSLLVERGVESRLITTTSISNIADSYSIKVSSYRSEDLSIAHKVISEYEKRIPQKQQQRNSPFS
jgi:hypothetical protein